MLSVLEAQKASQLLIISGLALRQEQKSLLIKICPVGLTISSTKQIPAAAETISVKKVIVSVETPDPVISASRASNSD